MNATLPREMIEAAISEMSPSKKKKVGSLAPAAKKVRAAGRFGDTVLVHVNKDEFKQMGQTFGPHATNPETGLPEFGWFGKLLKSVAPAAAFLIPGIGPVATALTAAGIGAGTAAISGDDPLKGAIRGGAIGAFPGIQGAVGATGNIGGSALVGAGLGAGSAALTGDNIGRGALYGGAGGALSGALNAGGAPGAESGTAGAVGNAAAAPNLSGLEEIIVRGAPMASAGGTLAGTAGLAAGQSPQPGKMEEIKVEGTKPTLDGGLPAPMLGNGGGNGLTGNGPAPAIASPTNGLGGGMEEINVSSSRLAAPDSASFANFAPLAFGAPGDGGTTGGVSDNLVDDEEKKKGLWPWIKNNKGVVAGGALLAASALGQKTPQPSGGAPPPGTVNNLNNIGNDQNARSQALMSYLNNGQLPAGAQAMITNATRAAKATLKSKFAQLGMSGSTSEATALAQVDQNAAAQTFDMAMNLYNTGMKQSGMSADIYRALLGYAQSQDARSDNENQRLDQAIVNFAAALAGARK